MHLLRIFIQSIEICSKKMGAIIRKIQVDKSLMYRHYINYTMHSYSKNSWSSTSNGTHHTFLRLLCNELTWGLLFFFFGLLYNWRGENAPILRYSFYRMHFSDEIHLWHVLCMWSTIKQIGIYRIYLIWLCIMHLEHSIVILKLPLFRYLIEFFLTHYLTNFCCTLWICEWYVLHLMKEDLSFWNTVVHLSFTYGVLRSLVYNSLTLITSLFIYLLWTTIFDTILEFCGSWQQAKKYIGCIPFVKSQIYKLKLLFTAPKF